MPIIDRDLGFRALMRRLRKAGLSSVTVGVHSDRGGELHGDSGTTIGAIAAFHEFGTAKTPQRSFIRAGIDANKSGIQQTIRRVSRLVVSNRRRMPPRQALGIIGLDAQRKIQAFIRNGEVQPALTERTIVRKGSTTPLLDTGQLIQSITFEVK